MPVIVVTVRYGGRGFTICGPLTPTGLLDGLVKALGSKDGEKGTLGLYEVESRAAVAINICEEYGYLAKSISCGYGDKQRLTAMTVLLYRPNQ